MFFYLFLLLLTSFSSICVSFSKNRDIRFLSKIITICILFIPAAIRFDIGSDYNSYIDIFYTIANGKTINNLESGWVLLNKFIIYFTPNAQWIIALSALLTLFFFFEEVESEKWFIYVPVFVCVIYTWFFTSLSQMLTMAMFFNAMLKYHKGKKNRAIIIAILSFFIHKSAILYLPIFIIANVFKYVIHNKITSVTLFFLLYLLAMVVFPKILTKVFAIIALTPYSYYAYGSNRFSKAAEVSSGLGRLLRYFAYFCIVLMIPNQENCKKLELLFLIYITMDFLSQTVMILSRIGRGIIFVYAPVAYEVFYSRQLRQIRRLTIICCIFVLFLLDLWGGFHNSIPYRTIFSNY